MGKSPRNRREKQRRRQKRAEKRRKARRPIRPGPSPSHVAGLPKMSDTVFAEPLLDWIADPNDVQVCRGVLLVASQVWNGLSLLERDDDHHAAVGELFLEEAEDALTNDMGWSEEHVADLFDVLAARKEALFPDESRLIMSIDAELNGDGLFVHAASTFE